MRKEGGEVAIAREKEWGVKGGLVEEDQVFIRAIKIPLQTYRFSTITTSTHHQMSTSTTNSTATK